MLRAILAQIQGIRPRTFYHSKHLRNVVLPCPDSPHSTHLTDDSLEFLREYGHFAYAYVCL